MKPAWDQLMDEFKDSKTAVVADVDCTVEEDLCAEQGIQGYPSIKHGSVDALEDYNGGRDFDALKEFASNNLGPSCSPDNLDLCSDDQKAAIADATALSQDCLLYTSDAADEEDSVDLGGRRIIKKKSVENE
eukprot:TRINITY_DN6043_c0_g1_i1.p1 TRINITY_DN6043_c0_g1~~TRINITY_DN6043_c0_g1_i1.p1  ORF type:complete len:132 (-),score=28.87 TRINITY_DN6043_c0_g1_i1:18-413(-)